MSEHVRPTKKQRELLDFIEAFISEHGYSPSYREIMNGLQYNSVATVALHVGNLIKRGHLRKRDHSARSLEVVHESDAVAGGEAGDSASVDDQVHEAWLVQRIDQFLLQRKQAADESANLRAEAGVLMDALRLLGLEEHVAKLDARLEQVS
jgi:SOS-response transcriptional repressor LexA